MSDKRISTVLARQQKHIVRDALAVVLLAVSLGLAAMMVAFHLPSLLPVQSQTDDQSQVVNDQLSPAKATAKQISEIPPWQ
jgi:hypothetical protein